MSKKQNNKDRSKTIIIILSVILTLLAVGLIINSLYTVFLYRENRTKSNNYTGSLIIDAVNSLNKPLVAEATTGKLYIPEARFSFPAPPQSLSWGTLLYNYSPSSTEGDGFEGYLQIASSSDIRAARTPIINATDTKALFEAVPKLQACARGVQIYFSPQKDMATADATKKLDNGKTAYFYTEKLCKNQDLLDYAQKLNSY